jgi:hypothetical protein
MQRRFYLIGLLSLQRIWMLKGALLNSMLSCVRMKRLFYKQRSWVQWLNLGDKNTKFFHISLLHLQVRNKIHGLTNETGARMIDQQDLGQLAVKYFQGLLSTH